MKNANYLFMSVLIFLCRAPFVVWCVVSLILFAIHPPGGFVIALLSGAFVVPWTLFGKWLIRECREDDKFNRRHK